MKNAIVNRKLKNSKKLEEHIYNMGSNLGECKHGQGIRIEERFIISD
jgi:hypothetical protein